MDKKLSLQISINVDISFKKIDQRQKREAAILLKKYRHFNPFVVTMVTAEREIFCENNNFPLICELQQITLLSGMAAILRSKRFRKVPSVAVHLSPHILTILTVNPAK